MLTSIDFMQMSPIFIACFMLMTSLFNGDVKGLVWLGCAILGILSVIFLSKLFGADKACAGDIRLLSGIKSHSKLSISTFFIVFTLMYLILPMQSNKDWNYYVIVGFLGMFILDALVQMNKFCMEYIGIFTGSALGLFFGWIFYSIIHSAGGDKLLYFNTISSNNVYCSKPKKQQFKCYVYKNGEIISAV